MQMLKNRLYQIELNKQLAKKAEMDANKSDVSFGSQIRSYVFQPYTMVNDHRTELKIPDVQKVMDGGIDPFIEAFLKETRRRAHRERGVSDELNFVQQARREKLDALVAAGVPPFAYGFDRTHESAAAVAALPEGEETGDDGARRRAARGVARTRQDGVRASRRCERDASSSTSARTSWATNVGRSSTCTTSATSSVSRGPLMRTRTGEVTVRVADGRDARQVAAPAAVRQGGGRRRADRASLRASPIRSSAIASATPISPCIPRCARCSSRARG